MVELIKAQQADTLRKSVGLWRKKRQLNTEGTD